jgi:hypothetical protein
MVRIRFAHRMAFAGLVMLAAALGLSSMSVGAEPAQQPPYPTVCPCTAELSVAGGTALTNECVSVTIRTTKDGNPNGGVKCNMSVIAQPGTGAYVDPTEVTTDENGLATVQLCAGTTAGTIVVKAKTDCCGSEGQVQVTAEEARPTAVLPEVGTPVVPPATGAGTGGDGSWPVWLIAICGAIALAAGSVFVWQIGSRRRPSS